MFTAPNEKSAFSELLAILGLGTNEIDAVIADAFLSNVWLAANEIWKDVDLTNYTNHDVDHHSMKIVRYFMDLDRPYSWSDYEKILFATAAIIHDIGMQYNKWAPPAGTYPELPTVPLSSSEIRRCHVSTGSELIRLQISGEFLVPFPHRFCDITSHGHRNALFLASFIAFAHSGDTYRRALIDQQGTWRDRPRFGGKFRPRLLAGMLRLCDELDGNVDRLLQPDKIYTWEVDNSSKAHWLACLFVEETEIQFDKYDVPHICVRWQAPHDATAAQREKIREFVSDMRISKINEELVRIREFFEECGEPHHNKEFQVDPLSPDPGRFSFTMTPGFEEIIDKAISTRYSREKQTEHRAEKHDEGYLANRVQETSRVRIRIPGLAIPLKEELKEWFERNRRTGHFELLNGEHTDVYLNCRTLVSNTDLLRSVAGWISSAHQSQSIDCVLVVGTSAIPVAVYVANRLRTSVTFTMARRKRASPPGKGNQETPGDSLDQAEGERRLTTLVEAVKQDYGLVEVIPSVVAGENLLVIDDVISGGNVVIEILKELEALDRKPGLVYHHSLFRLGSRMYVEDERIAKYEWIVHLPDVMYAAAEDCPLCHSGEAVVRESEMY
jgi:orotate phosphoribosyltransferase